MGNCQSAAAAAAAPAAEIEHPDGKLERIYCPINACNVMFANPGYYVAVVTCSAGDGEEAAAKLLQPDDDLHVGHAYRLISYEEVLREFGSKKRVRLSRLIQRQKERDEREMRDGGANEGENTSPEMDVGPSISSNGGRTSGCAWRQPQWKPTLQTIAELGIY